MKYYDVLMSVLTYACIEANSREEAIEIANSGKYSTIFPNDIMTDDIVEMEYGGKIYEAED